MPVLIGAMLTGAGICCEVCSCTSEGRLLDARVLLLLLVVLRESRPALMLPLLEVSASGGGPADEARTCNIYQ